MINFLLLIVPIIGLLISAIALLKSTVSNGVVSNDKNNYCPKCGKVNNTIYSCPHCGTAVC